MKKLLIAALIGFIIGFLTGFFVGKGVYDKPIKESVTHDTITVHDTIPDITPTPKDSAVIQYITRWLPSKRDTVSQVEYVTIHDSVEVEIPITSKHYGNETYDAWVSGFEPNLDSIRVYRKTEYITTTITKIKPTRKWELDFVGGIDYVIDADKYYPYASCELMYKPNRFQVGLQGGVVKNGNKAEPFIGIEGKIRIF